MNKAIILSLLKTLVVFVEELLSFEDENALSKSVFRFVNGPLFSLTVVDELVNNSCKGLMSGEEFFVAIGKTFEVTIDGSSKQPIDSSRFHIQSKMVPKPNKSGGFSITTGSIGLEIDVVEGDGVIDMDRSLPACRTGLLVDTGAANGLIFGMLFEVNFST